MKHPRITYRTYLYLIFALISAKSFKTWDCIRYIKRIVHSFQNGKEDFFEVEFDSGIGSNIINENFQWAQAVVLIIYELVEFGFSQQFDALSPNDIRLQIVNELRGYIPFIKACVKQMHKVDKFSVDQIKKIFDDLRLTL